MQFLPPELERYAESFTSPEPELLARLNAETREQTDLPQMLSGHLQGRVLSMISKMIRPDRILEVGTFTGYSALCLAEGLAPGGRLDTLDINPDMEERIRRYIRDAGQEERIFFHLGDAAERIPELGGPLDLVFIDADKPGYARYFDLVIDLLRPGGFILADNVLWSGKVLEQEQDEDTAALHAYNRKIASDPRVEQVLLPIRDGILIARKIG